MLPGPLFSVGDGFEIGGHTLRVQQQHNSGKGTGFNVSVHRQHSCLVCLRLPMCGVRVYLQVWDAGIVLAKYFSQPDTYLLQGKKAIEIGVPPFHHPCRHCVRTTQSATHIGM